ncbi:inorganic phosphate transporter, partial [Conidiobolus coronatus NRRL 28638]
MSGMQQQLLGIGLVMGLVQVAKRLDLEDPAKLPYLRASYLTAQVICLAIYGYIYTQIQAKKDTTPLTYEEKKGFSQEATQVSTTVGEYDRAELMKALQGVVMGMAFLGFLHLKMGYVQPLFLQSILPLKNLFDNKLVKIYILGQKAEGALKRPWIAANPF